jgi:general stress protein YciG
MASSNQGKQDGGTQGASQRRTSGRGFASMDPERQRQIASQGGKAAHEKGTAHEFTPEEARQAGSKGGDPAEP